MPSLGALEIYAEQTSAALIDLAARILSDGRDCGIRQLANHAGIAYAIAFYSTLMFVVHGTKNSHHYLLRWGEYEVTAGTVLTARAGVQGEAAVMAKAGDALFVPLRRELAQNRPVIVAASLARSLRRDEPSFGTD